MRKLFSAFVVAFAFAALAAQSASAQTLLPPEPESREAAIVDGARQVLDEVMAVPVQGIPRALLVDAQGIALVPGLIKGGFVVGVRHGRGVLVIRDETGPWRAPAFISITGGSIGWQIGVQATDVVLVFKTRNSLKNLLNGTFTIGGDVAVAAGPIGRQAQAATDAQLRAEIFSYSRSRGLFAGVSLDGAVLKVDTEAAQTYYRGTTAGQAPAVPPSAQRLLATIARYTGTETAAATPAPAVPQAQTVAPAAAVGASLQTQLADSARRMNAILDDRWKNYLALPPEVYAPDRQATVVSLNPALTRFNEVATDPKYRALADRNEFRQTHALLKQVIASQATPAPVQVPPPAANRR